jgi:hypothetical protein
MKLTLKRTDKGIWQLTAVAEGSGGIKNLKKIIEWLYEPEADQNPFEK